MNDNVYDTTQEKRSIVSRELWPMLSFDELLVQKNILFDRWEFLQRKGFTEQAKVFIEALEKVDSLIQEKLQNAISTGIR